MEIPAKVSTKGQITIPKQIREELGIAGGEEIVFRIERGRAVMALTPHLLGEQTEDVAAPPPASPRTVPWDAARRSATRRHPSKGAVLVRDSDGNPLTIELVDENRHPASR